ncbi:MAG: dTDP-4-dehydrorhamnose reductase [Nitrospirota bacterium]|nr:MAG: dTDP-4-dehydrorhamnose reductase [Nitrospirota bacterium]
MRVFIAGAKGQLGHALQETLGHHEVIAYDQDELDITQLEATRKVLEQVRPQVVLNAAAYTKVDQAESEPEMAFRINALGARNLALTTASQKIPLLQISTDYVFDGKALRPYHEFDRPHPLSVYGMSKLAGEDTVRALNPRHFIVRTAWLYHTVGNNFPKTICALADQPEIRVVNDQYGSPTYAPHLAQALSRLMETDAFGTYHIAGSGGTSWFEFTRTLFTLCGFATKIKAVSKAEFPRPAPRPAHAVLTTLQDPHMVLPPWEQGLQEFVRQRFKFDG